MIAITHNPCFPRLLAGVLLLATVVAYLPSFQGAFLFDDQVQIVLNPNIKTLPAFVADLPWNNRPVIFFTLWANYQLGELNVFGYHLVNLLVHLTAGLLLFDLIRRALRGVSSRGVLDRMPDKANRGVVQATGEAHASDPHATNTTGDWLAFVVALMWLIHPLQTQAVTYIVQRCESMMGMFYLLSLYCLLRAAQSAAISPRPLAGEGQGVRVCWYAAGIVAVWLGMGCKEVMATAPFVMLLFDRIFLAASWRDVFRRRWGFYLAMVPAVVWLVVVTFVRRELVEGMAMDELPSRFEYLLSQPAIILHYLRLTFLPDKLCFDYRWKPSEGWTAVVLPGLAMSSLFLASLLALWLRPRIGFLMVSFFLILAPTSSINPVDDRAVEHRMYLPLAIIILLTALALSAAERAFRIPQRRLAAWAIVVILLAVTLITRTFVRNRLYSKPAAVWANVLAHAPDNVRACNNLASCFLDASVAFEEASKEANAAGDEVTAADELKNAEQQLDEAIRYYRRAIEIDPTLDLPYCNLGRIFERKRQYAEGTAVLREGLAATKPSVLLRCGLGDILDKQGKPQEAIAEYRRAVEINPKHGRSQYRLGRMLSLEGRPEEAIPHLEAAIPGMDAGQLRGPAYLACHFRLALAYQRCGQFDKAIEHYERALESDPTLDKARRNVERCRQGDRNGEPPLDELQHKAKRAGPTDRAANSRHMAASLPPVAEVIR